jgi:hypothetical protein
VSTSSTPDGAAVLRAERGATAVGAISTALGVVLLLAPEATARLLGIRPERGLTAIGVADVAIGVGLLAGRPRWPWLVARAAANPPSAWWFARAGRRDGGRGALLAAAAVGAVTVGDVATARTLRAADR